jgi:hypothetical protein
MMIGMPQANPWCCENKLTSAWTKSMNMQLQIKSKFDLLLSHWTSFTHSIFIITITNIHSFFLVLWLVTCPMYRASGLWQPTNIILAVDLVECVWDPGGSGSWSTNRMLLKYDTTSYWFMEIIWTKKLSIFICVVKSWEVLELRSS